MGSSDCCQQLQENGTKTGQIYGKNSMRNCGRLKNDSDIVFSGTTADPGRQNKQQQLFPFASMYCIVGMETSLNDQSISQYSSIFRLDDLLNSFPVASSYNFFDILAFGRRLANYLRIVT